MATKKTKKYVVVRCKNESPHVGYLEKQDDKNRVAVLTEARRIWYWDGAATLSQIATDGVSKPKNCKFPAPVIRITLYEVIGIIEATEKAKKNIAQVPEWKE